MTGLAVAENTANLDRQQTKYVVMTTDSGQVKSVPGIVYSVTMLATNSNAWIAVYDQSSGIGSGNPKIEIGEATSGNSSKKDIQNGLNFYNGIKIEGANANAIVYYY